MQRPISWKKDIFPECMHALGPCRGSLYWHLLNLRIGNIVFMDCHCSKRSMSILKWTNAECQERAVIFFTCREAPCRMSILRNRRVLALSIVTHL